jgi:hypothetical protein
VNTTNTSNTKFTNFSNDEMEVEKSKKNLFYIFLIFLVDFSNFEKNNSNNPNFQEYNIMTPVIEHDNSGTNSVNNCSLNNDINMNTPNKSIISKRILCELIKSDTSEREQEIVYQISKKLDFLIDVILNKCENKIHFIQLFMCFIVEINSELIRMIPEYTNMTDNLNIRFIMPAKNIYNFAIEVYFSIYDLYNVRIS